jgi:hypothetical protein
MSGVTPPDDNIGLGKNFFGKTTFHVIECSGPDFKIFVFRKEARQSHMDTFGVNLADFFLAFLMNKFVPYKYADHTPSPLT